MKTLTLRSCGFKTHKSMVGAIGAAFAVNRASAAPAITEVLRGKRCVRVGSSDTEVVFQFEDSHRLKVTVSPGLPDVFFALDRAEAAEALPVAADVMMQFVRASGEMGKRLLWPRSRIAECVGRALLHVFWNGDHFYVAWQGRKEQFSFHPVEDVSAGTIMLYWWEEE